MAELKHLSAFEYYYSLGSARSYEKVAQKFNKSNTTIGKWGKNENWQEEVRYRDTEQLKENRRISLIGRREKASDYKKIVEASLGQYVEKLKKGKIEIKSVKDLEILIKLMGYLDDYVIDGENAVIVENSLDEVVKENSSENNEKIQIVFDINGGVSDED